MKRYFFHSHFYDGNDDDNSIPINFLIELALKRIDQFQLISIKEKSQ